MYHVLDICIFIIIIIIIIDFSVLLIIGKAEAVGKVDNAILPLSIKPLSILFCADSLEFKAIYFFNTIK